MYKIKESFTFVCKEHVLIIELILFELLVACWNYRDIQHTKLHLNRIMTVEGMDVIYLSK